MVGPIKASNGELLIKPEEISDALNEYFASVFTNENVTDTMPEVKTKFEFDSSHMLSTFEINRKDILVKLGKLKDSKAPGYDGIVPVILRMNAEVLSVPLLSIFLESLETGMVPLDWRRANITALFKNGSREMAQNYRPISLTSQACKMLESIIKDKIVAHLDKYKLINDTQHGFVSKRSCLTNLLEFYEFVSQYTDQGYPVDVIYLDFQKAFDKVPHKRLMTKIKAMGISGNLYNWIENWLNDREQRVVLLGKNSGLKAVKSGVPQGSVLGPLLFLIYVNDIDVNINTHILKFADDTKIFSVVTTEDDVKRLRMDLKNVCAWSEEWLMLFNVKKCKILHLGYNNEKAIYEIDGNVLEEVDEERDLGIIFQKDLKWNRQCAKAVSTANRILGMIKRNFICLNKVNFLCLYKSLVRPHLEYCIQVWRPHLRKDIDLLEGVQRRATKLVRELQGKDYEARLKYLGLTTLETRRLRGDLIEVFKILKGFEKVDPARFFKTNSSDRTRGHSLKLFKCQCRLDIGRFAFSNRVVNMWNSLSEDVVACDTVTGFKIRIDRALNSRGFI